MSTRVGIIAEGPIDLALLPPILSRIAEERAGVNWPVQVADAFEWLQMRPRGQGRSGQFANLPNPRIAQCGRAECAQIPRQTRRHFALDKRENVRDVEM